LSKINAARPMIRRLLFDQRKDRRQMFLRQLTWAATAAAVFIGFAAPGLSNDLSRERLVYEISMSYPGDRIQGWGGTLFRQDGTTLPVGSGMPMLTSFGRFVPMGPCPRPFRPCGFVEERMSAAPSNKLMGPTPWLYSLHVRAECFREEKVRGELNRGGQKWVGVAGDMIETPMGPFEWRATYSEEGWFPKLWPQHTLTPGAWPCPK
jgi:hypothetical protein